MHLSIQPHLEMAALKQECMLPHAACLCIAWYGKHTYADEMAARLVNFVLFPCLYVSFRAGLMHAPSD